jgi:hypothetical protein
LSILQILYEGYNQEEQCFANCVILIKESDFSNTKAYEISRANKFPICSEIQVNQVIEERALDPVNNVADLYMEAKSKDHAFISFRDKSNAGLNGYHVPRFSEKDFENIIVQLGGEKIPESTVKTPDFLLYDVALELKDLQTDSLFNKDRQNTIAEAFENQPGYTVNLDPTIDYGTPTDKYRRLITNTIKNHIKNASEQIKSYKEQREIASAGIIFLNTGMFSLPHDTFMAIVDDVINRETRTIEFGLVFSQVMQSNGWDLKAVFMPDFVGNVPEQIKVLRSKLGDLIDQKMTDMMLTNPAILTTNSMHPISFCKNNKIFYWNPGRMALPWENKS